MQSKRPILLVEDPETGERVARRAFDGLGIGDRVVSATIPEAIPYLREQTEQRPCVVLLSVDDVGNEGLATLKMIKQDDQLRTLPVVVIGPSGDAHMVDESFGLGAAGYMVKSPDSLEFSETMRTLYEYWNLSELPK